MTDPRTYVYEKGDRVLGKKVSYYYDFLEKARRAGYSCFADWVLALYWDRGSASGVADVLGVSYTTVNRWIRRLGLTARGRGGSQGMEHPQRDEVGDLYRQLRSGHKVAAVLGISTSTVYKWLKADGIGKKGKTSA